MPGNNAANRVKLLVDRVTSAMPNVTMIEGLKKVFDFEPRDPERDLARRIEALHLQLDLADTQLRASGFPDNLYRRQFSKLRDAFRPALLQQSFGHVRSMVDEAAQLCLDWCAFALADEGSALEKTKAEVVASEIEELLSGSMLSDLPPGIQDLLSVHLRAILDALRMVDIEGSAPLQKATKAAAAELVVHADEIDAAAKGVPTDQAGFLKKCGSVMKQAMEAAATGGKGAEGIEKMIKLMTERGPQALEIVTDVIKRIAN